MLLDATRRRLLTGVALAATALAMPAIAADDIVVGQIGPWTVLPVPDVPQLNLGLKSYFAQVNARGGVNGRKISLFELDDAYSGAGFVKRFNEAMQRKPVALLTPLGSEALKRMFDDKLLDQHDVVVLNAVPGAESFRNPGHPRLFHLRAGDRQQVDKMVLHARTLGITKLFVMYETIPMGESAVKMAKDAVQRVGQIEISTLGAPRQPEPIAETAQKIAKAGTQCVLVLGSPRFSVDAIAQLRKAGVSQSMFAFSYVPSPLVSKVAGEEAARGVGITQTFPNPVGVNTQLQRDFQAAMKESAPQVAPTSYTSFHLEGYVTARVLVEALRRSPQITPEHLARTLKTMGEIDLGGFRVNFAKSNAGSSYVDIGVVTMAGRLMY